jgi:hypothetical protein
MNNEIRMSIQRLRAVGIPVGDLPEVPPQQDGHVLFALITNSGSREFAIAVHDAYVYGTYRTMTEHPGDRGNWFFRKMELFFVPENSIAPE